MLKITKTQKIGLLSILMLTLMIVGYVFAYISISDLYVKLGQVYTELASATQIVENKQTTISLLEDTESGRKELEGYFVSVQDPTQFLNLIDWVANDVGVVSQAEKVEVLPIDEIYGKYPEEVQKKIEIILSVEGTWEEMYHFISLLELFTYAVSIDNVALTYNEEGNNSPWSGQIHIHSLAM